MTSVTAAPTVGGNAAASASSARCDCGSFVGLPSVVSAPPSKAPIATTASTTRAIHAAIVRQAPSTSGPAPAVLPWLTRFALAARHRGGRGRDPRAVGREPRAARATRRRLGTSFERTGTLNVYETHDGSRGRAHARGERSGLRFDVLDADQTRELEPALIGPVVGSVRYPDEGRVDPRRFVETVGRAAAAGVEIRTGAEVGSLDELDAETVVVAAGAWSAALVDLPLEGGKGYHVDFERSTTTRASPPGCRRPGRSRRRSRTGCGSRERSSSPGSTSPSRSLALRRSARAASGGSGASPTGR